MRICLKASRGGVLLSALIMLAVLTLFSCGHSSNHSSSSQLAAAPATTPPPHKAIALTGPGAGGGGNNNLDDEEEVYNFDDPPTEQWVEPDFGRTVTIASDCVIIALHGPWTQPAPEELPIDIAPLDEAFENNVTVQSLLASGFELMQTWGEVNGGLFKLPPGMSVTQALSALPMTYPGIWKIYPNSVNEPCIAPNDPTFLWQWNYHNNYGDFDVDAPQAWDLETGDENTIVAVIDTGVVRFCFPNKITSWGAEVGRRLLTTPWLVGGGQPIIGSDKWEHGTRVSSVIAAPTNDYQNIAGSMWQCKVFPVRLNSWETAAEFNAYRVVAATKGIIWDSRFGTPLHAPQNYPGMKSVNYSFSGAAPNFLGMKFLYRYLGAYTVFVCAAGNSTTWQPYYPAGNKYYTGYMPDLTVGVAAFGQDGYLYYDQPGKGTNYGLYNCDLAAPGKDVLVFNPTSLSTYNVTSVNGTSFASPHVAALAALRATLYPNESSMMTLNRVMYGSLKYSPPLLPSFQLEHGEPMPVQSSFYNCLVSQ